MARRSWPTLAARLGLALAANVTEVRPGDPWQVTRQRWGGSLLEEARLDGPIRLLTVAPHAFAPAAASAAGAPATVQPFAPDLDDRDFRVRITSHVPAEEGVISLADARVVVGGGRGVGSAEGFAQLDELAALLGGTVGVSRVVTSAGWRPHAQQVGQTGTRIAPDLYIACGISGAIQHMVGARSAKAILAINTDRDAPMVTPRDLRRDRRPARRPAGDHRGGSGGSVAGGYGDSAVLLPVGPGLAGRPDVGADGRADGRVDVVRRDPLEGPVAAQPFADRVLQLGEGQGDARLRQLVRELDRASRRPWCRRR